MEHGRYYGVCAATLEAVRLRHPIVVVVAGGSLDGLNLTRALERCELYNFRGDRGVVVWVKHDER